MSKQLNNISILIPDGESHLLRVVIYCLAQVKNIKLFVMSNNRNIAMRYSRYIYKSTFYDKTDSDLDWINNINKEVEENDIDLIIPIWDDGFLSLAKHNERIIKKDRLGLLSSFESINTAKNKGLLANYLDTNNIPHPKSVLIENKGQLVKAKGLKLPIIIKPLEGFAGGYGIRKFYSQNDLDEYTIKMKDIPYIFQEYIEGYDIDCSVLCKEGAILTYTIQKGNLNNKKEFGPPTGLDFLYENELYVTVQKLMKSLNWSGVAHIDMRYDKNDNQFKVIEVNARFWGTLDGSLIAGVNFPYLYYLVSRNISFNKPTYKHIKFLNAEGLVQTVKKNFWFVFRWHFIFNYTSLKYRIKDPFPIIYNFFKRGS